MTNDERHLDDRSVAVRRAADRRIRELALQRIDEVESEIGTLPVDEALLGDLDTGSDSGDRAPANPPGE